MLLVGMMGAEVKCVMESATIVYIKFAVFSVFQVVIIVNVKLRLLAELPVSICWLCAKSGENKKCGGMCTLVTCFV